MCQKQMQQGQACQIGLCELSDVAELVYCPVILRSQT